MKTPRISTKLILALALACAPAVACVAPSEGDLPDATDAAAGEEQTGEVEEALNTEPTSICVTAHSATNSGTGNSLKIGYYSAVGGYYACTLSGGVGTGQSACCTPSQESHDPLLVVYGFSVGYSGSSNTDGLRVTNIKALFANGDSMSAGTFTGTYYPSAGCEGCTLGTFCNSCWIDADDHGKCKSAFIVGRWIQGYGDNAFMCE
jgi:hypothetical protein